MQLSPSNSILGAITGRDYYETEDGVKISVKKGTGDIQVDDNGSIIVENAKGLRIKGTDGDNDIFVKDSDVKTINIKGGSDNLRLDNCKFNFMSRLYSGKYIDNGFKKNQDQTNIIINGDFNGYANLQHDGAGWMNSTHKDNVVINGDNKGNIQVDKLDSVRISGKKGRVTHLIECFY